MMSKLLRPTGLVRTARLLSQAGPRFKACQLLRPVASPVQPRLARSYSIQVKSSPLTKATSRDDERMVEMTWGSGEVSRYPYAWLRDCCRCDKCYLHTANSRVLPMLDWKVTTKPADIVVSEDESEVRIVWDNGHQSCYSATWLRSKQFTPETREHRARMLHPPKPVLWGHEMQHSIPTDSFHNILTDNTSLLGWLDALIKYGIFIIKDTPQQTGQIKQLAARVSFFKRTCYGDVFTVKATKQAINHAYTSYTLGMHTDLADHQHTPGVQILHCIKQVPAKGGENVFADGFYVAEQMRKERPDLFKILSETTLEFRDIGEVDYKFHMLAKHKTFEFNDQGEYTQVTFNNQSRSAYMNLPPEQVHTIYEALHLYNDLLYDDSNLIKIKLQPGDLVCFHNHRVLHGREGFEVLQDGERHLEGSFFAWDDLHSKRRVLLRELA